MQQPRPDPAASGKAPEDSPETASPEGAASGGIAAEAGRAAPFPWLPFYDPGVPSTLSLDPAPLYAWLDKAAEETPRRLACRFYNTRLTYAALRRLAEVVAANLRRHGLRPGDRVGVMLPNMPQTLVVFWGILKAGGVVTMINPLYREKELLHQIRDAGATHLVTIDLCWSRLNALRDRLGVRHFYVTTAAEGLSFPLNWLQRLKNWWNKTTVPVLFDQDAVHPFSVLLRAASGSPCLWKTRRPPWPCSSIPAAPPACPRAPCFPTPTWAPTWNS